MLIPAAPADAASADLAEPIAKGEDGSIKIHLSAKPKPAVFKGNYLQIVADVPFYALLRIYNPAQEVVDDTYAPPPLIREGGLRV